MKYLTMVKSIIASFIAIGSASAALTPDTQEENREDIMITLPDGFNYNFTLLHKDGKTFLELDEITQQTIKEQGLSSEEIIQIARGRLLQPCSI